MRHLSFFVATQANGATRVHVPIDGGEPDPSQLLSLVTGRIGKVGQETQLGIRQKVPDAHLKRGRFMITEAEYVVPLSRLFSWKVTTVTEGFELKIEYPEAQFVPEVETFLWDKPAYSERQIPERTGMIQLCYHSKSSIIPEGGLAWRFRRRP